MKIFAGRASLIGDTVMALPMLNCLHKMYDNPEITWALAPKCKQAAPLYLFQDKITSIVLTKDSERLVEREELEEQYDLVLDVFPPHRKEQDWYNHRSCVEETMLMAAPEIWNVWKTLPKDQQQPRLNRWWYDQPTTICDILTKKRVAVHITAGYGKGLNRSPSIKWWEELCKILQDDYNLEVIQFGYWTDKQIEDVPFEIKNYSNFSLFQQVQLATECDYYIGTDSGFSWIINSYGLNKCISLITQWENGHRDNPFALAPENWAGKNHNLFGANGCDSIKHEEVLKLL